MGYYVASLVLSLPVHTHTDTHTVFPPVLMMRPTEIVTGIGQSVSLSCSANSSDGMVNVSIETTAPNGQSVPPQPTSVQLTLSNPMPGDRGVYTCVATNARGTVRANATVYVVGECVGVCARHGATFRY